MNDHKFVMRREALAQTRLLQEIRDLFREFMAPLPPLEEPKAPWAEVDGKACGCMSCHQLRAIEFAMAKVAGS